MVVNMAYPPTQNVHSGGSGLYTTYFTGHVVSSAIYSQPRTIKALAMSQDGRSYITRSI